MLDDYQPMAKERLIGPDPVKTLEWRPGADRAIRVGPRLACDSMEVCEKSWVRSLPPRSSGTVASKPAGSCMEVAHLHESRL